MRLLLSVFLKGAGIEVQRQRVTRLSQPKKAGVGPRLSFCCYIFVASICIFGALEIPSGAFGHFWGHEAGEGWGGRGGRVYMQQS